ncbi:MAG: hypothetical protein JXA82_00165 [Sedimentisphaerales bacterium]|nr:hypothetical protein [Sedimentisphaerales bacterium]
MINILEEPWLLLFVSLVILGGIVLFRQSGCGQEFSGKLFFIPVGIALLAFGLDRFVRTDREAIEYTLNRSIRFVRTRNFDDFDNIFSPNYSDAFHRNRVQLRHFCESSLAMADIERLSKRRFTLTLKTDNAEAELSVLVRLRSLTQSYAGSKSLFFVEARLHFEAMPDGRWLICSCELVSLNNQPFSWGGVP